MAKEYINKTAFLTYKKQITINEAEIKKVVFSKTDSYGNKIAFKYFIGYIRNAGIIPMYIIFSEINAYCKYFKGNKRVNLLVHNKKILKKYNEIWSKIKSLLKKGFNGKLVYNEKYIKTKKSLYNMNFYGNILP